MNLKTSLFLFLSLFIAHFWGNKTLTLNLHENYYVINLMELIVGVLMIILSIFLLKNIFLKLKKNQL